MNISIVIPTLNAEKEIDQLLTKLDNQTLPLTEILVIDSSSDDKTLQIVKQHSLVRTHTIFRKEFNHGTTRNQAFRMTIGDIVVFMTQDAIPRDDTLIERLITPLQEEKTIASYARQIPKEDASPREKLVREFNYPKDSECHTKADIPNKGIKTFFFSDVCAAYRRKEFEELSGFERDVLTNEDMFFAANAIQHGYSIFYAAGAEVYHSHNLSLKEQYQRNQLQGYELARHRELLESDSPINSGKELFKYVSKGLLKQGRLIGECRFILDCAARYLGNRAGKRKYEKER